MAAPWATASGATITVGEVTGVGLLVTTGGAPDANWYCQFRSGSRFVRGSFGVAGSGRDFVWSLASFQTGNRGTLGTVVLTATGAAVVVENTMSLSLPASTATNYPYQFGRVFKQGVIANYPQVLIDGVAQATQADVKNRWPDGSVKFAILSLIVPSLSTTAKTFTFQNQATVNSTPETKANMLANYDFNCTINATSGGSPITGAPVAARTILNAISDATLASNTSGDSPNSRYWTQGPICTTVILCDHTAKTYDFGTSASKVLRPIFHVQFWPTLAKYKVRVIVESSDVTKLQDQTYDVSLSTGNASAITVYTQTSVAHHVAGRWTKSFWSGYAPVSISVDHNANYLSNTKTLPYYDPTAKLTETQIQAQVTRFSAVSTNFFDGGFWMKSMPAPGGREEIALLPNWTVDALLSGDYRLQNISDKHAEMALAWPMNFREGSSTKLYNAAQTVSATGLPINLYARPDLFLFDNNYLTGYQYGSYFTNAADRLTFVGWNPGDSWPTNSNGWNVDGAHQPAPYLVPYVTTGEYLWLEQMQLWSSWAAFNSQNQTGTGSGFYGRGSALTSAALPGDTRRQAWILRNRVSAAAFSVDSSHEKTYHTYMVNSAIAIAEGIREVAGGAGQGSADYIWGQTIGRADMYGNLGISPLYFWDANQGGTESFAFQYQSRWNVPISRAQAPFQSAYMIIALAHSKDLGFETANLLNWLVKIATIPTKNNQTGWLIGNFVNPLATTTPLAFIGSWDQVYSCFIDQNYPQTDVLNTINSSDGPPASMAAAISMITDLTDGLTCWNWIVANWISARNPSFPIPSRWRNLPRP